MGECGHTCTGTVPSVTSAYMLRNHAMHSVYALCPWVLHVYGVIPRVSSTQSAYLCIAVLCPTDPFSSLFGALAGGIGAATAAAANGGAGNGSSFMFSSSSFSSLGPSGVMYQASSTTRMGPGGVSTAYAGRAPKCGLHREAACQDLLGRKAARAASHCASCTRPRVCA